MTELYLQMGIALVLVSGLILLLGLFVRKRQDKDCLMRVMGYQSLGPKKGIAMVKAGNEVLLVGVTASDVKLLKTVEGVVEKTDEQRSTTPAADQSPLLAKLRAMKESLYAAQ
jgi:flagellar biogenesis protein FliO